MCLGLFLGLLTLVGGIIILIIFFVMKETPEYRAQMHWIYAGKRALNVVFNHTSLFLYLKIVSVKVKLLFIRSSIILITLSKKVNHRKLLKTIFICV